MPPRTVSARGSASSRGRGRGDSGATRGGPVAIASHVRTVGVKRPGFGTGGRTIQVTVNTFEARVTDGVIYHYDVAITPDKLPARVNNLLFQSLQTQSAPHVFNNGPLVYDGRKNAFSMYKLQFGPSDTAQYSVSLPQQGPPSDRPPKVYTMKLTKVAEINTEILHRFTAGQQTQDNAVHTSLMALNVVIRMEPNLKYPFNTRSFFTNSKKKDINAGLELWQGYFQSLRPSQNKLYVNIDISTGVMYKAINLVNLCLEFFRRNNPGDLSNIPDRDRVRLQRFISNVRIETNYGRKRIHVIKKLSRDSARTLMFSTREGTSMSVETYFKSLNVPLRFPLLPCVEVGRGAMIPLETCNVLPGQLMRKQFPEDKTTDMVNFARKQPADRLAAIREGLNVLQYGQSEYVRRFGMQINPTPMTVTARVLLPPTLRYGGSQATIKPANGLWNMRDKKFYKPETIRKWGIVIFENERFFNKDAVNNVINGFIQGAQGVGIQIVDKSPLVKYARGHGNIPAQLTEAGKEIYNVGRIPPTLIVVILPEANTQIYSAVKHFGDVMMGVATQCLKAKKCNRANPQYWANVMLKVNAKLGGINNILDNSPLNDPNHPTIVMGADVIHPAPGTEGRPSFTGLVTSVDQYTAKYVATSKVQTGRQEIIADLEEMVKYSLSKYTLYRRAVEKSNTPPSRLIFYRDGVSEGQFKTVLEEELPAIKNACRDAKLNLKITLIIVGKRHHIRMFPQASDADKSGNCPAGTTIDSGLGDPAEYDYYQLSHGGLIGTSRPAHYNVIYDDNNFSADAIQNLSFSLAHVYARATRSVSIPAPVYYADIVCARSKNHFSPDVSLETTDAESQASSAVEAQLERYKREYKPLHDNMSRNMYFM